MGAGGDDETTSRELFTLDGDSVRVEKVGITIEANDARLFNELAVIAASTNGSLELARNKSGGIKGDGLTLDLRKRTEFSIGMSKIKGNGIWDVNQVEISATKETLLDEGYAFFGFR